METAFEAVERSLDKAEAIVREAIDSGDARLLIASCSERSRV
jgi:hypothetical protein